MNMKVSIDALGSIVTAALGAGILTVVACTSTIPSDDSWVRTYLASRDRVIDAVVDVLEHEEYLVEPDRKAGLVHAESSRRRSGQGLVLEVRIREKGDRIHVDVQARWGVAESAAAVDRMDAPIREFFHELDVRLHRAVD